MELLLSSKWKPQKFGVQVVLHGTLMMTHAEGTGARGERLCLRPSFDDIDVMLRQGRRWRVLKELEDVDKSWSRSAAEVDQRLAWRQMLGQALR